MIQNINYIEIKNCIVDRIHIRQNVQNPDLTPNKEDWQFDSILLAKFLGNLEAGNVELGGLIIDNWKIRRRRIDITQLIEIANIPSGNDGNLYYLDLSPRAGVIYEYDVSPMSGDIEGQSYAVQIECKFDYWWLSDGEESYPFFGNLEVSDINTNMQRHEYLGFNPFPIISYGNAKYRSGSITAILLDTFLDTNYNYREKVLNFINNKKPKLLKSPYGDLMIVDTHTSSRKQYTELIENISSVTFNFTEISEVVE